MIKPTVQIDPLNSPHPIPWEWILATHAELSSTLGSGVRYYRSPSLISSNGEYAAYTCVELQVQRELYYCRTSSVMFVENLSTGDLQTVTASSPIAKHQFYASEESNIAGTMAILIPVSWNNTGDRILAREFEGIFGTSDMTDYALIWDTKKHRAHTIAPVSSLYSHAILLGWSQSYPDEVLFRAGDLGDRVWSVWAVDLNGRTVAANQDKPVVFGGSQVSPLSEAQQLRF
ncbi:hypothetical protein BCD67_06680 [Oscillatoriales cyanobacterium USR001]|nr:hypothetical protein BCD67_06680 [Oscillatoriales cyanobacterium USR001]